ncbi:MAG: hypothetical protein RJA70_2498 [Pseudomonadota bacterium]
MDTVEIELGLDSPDDPEALRQAVAKKLRTRVENLPPVVLRKRALDCRRGRVRFHLLFEVGAERAQLIDLALPHPKEVQGERRTVIIGDGPCGLFCAYELARRGIACTVVDRGKLVQPRRKDLKGLTRRGSVDPDSNYCFGEGGAGTYSDGKLYTRAHKRGPVRDILEILALHGAPEEILTEARPHIGSNRLPKVVTAIRERLEAVGVQFLFGKRVVEILRAGSASSSVAAAPSEHAARVTGLRFADGTELPADHVVLATGHSARDVFTMLHDAGHPLEPKAFAMGTRIEHPQTQINTIQYGTSAGHPKLPSAAYRLVESKKPQAVFSFCMCPGGFIVPASTAQGELVVNGMSLAKRSSRYANSGIVVSVEPEDFVRAGFTGPLGGVELQAAVERAGFSAGGALLQAPATRVPDFLAGRASSTTPKTSYVPGLTATNLAEVFDAVPLGISLRLHEGLRAFDKQLSGFISEEAVLVGVESRTSSPVRIPRDSERLMSRAWYGLYPAGEGAGYAGGIVSAALDGLRIAECIARELNEGRAS